MKPVPLERWIVFFGSGHARGAWWLRLITQPGFRHCFACAFDPLREEWVMFWPSWPRLEIRLVPGAYVEHWLAQAYSGRLRALKVTARPGSNRLPIVIGCAGAIAWLLGIAAGGLLTGWQLRPQALFRHLLARGATEVTMPMPEQQRADHG